MALQNLEEALLRKAKEEADAILSEERRAAEARFEREAARLRAEHQRGLETMTAALEGDLDREAGIRASEDRLKILKVKNDLLAEVFDRAVEGIRNLPNDGYRKWLRGRIERLPDMKGGQVAAHEADRGLVADLLKEFAAKGLTLAEKPAPIRAGILVRGEQVDLDLSVDSLLGAVKESLAEEIAKELFAEA